MDEYEFKKKIEYTKIMLEEYKTLRSEIVSKQGYINNIINFSFAIIGATLAAIANNVRQGTSQGNEFVLIATSMIIPFVCWFAFIQYYLEFIYIARISRYIVVIEYSINKQLNEHLLFWESGIREWDNHNDKHEELRRFMHIEDKLVKKLLVLPLTFFLIAVSSAIFSIFYSFLCCGQNYKLTITTYGFIGILFLLGIFLWYRFNKEVKRLDWNRIKSGI